MVTNQDKLNHLYERIGGNNAAIGKNIAWFVTREAPIPGFNGEVSLAARIAGTDEATNFTRAVTVENNALLKNLTGAVAALAKGEAFDEAKLLAGIKATLDANSAAQSATIQTALAAQLEQVKVQVKAALDAADIDGQVKAGLVSSIASITTSTTAQVKGA